MELNITRTINELVAAIAYALDVIDEGVNLYHSWRVSIFASELAKSISPDERKHIFYASLLHDIGYLALPNHITHYIFTKEDHTKDPIILSHPIIGAEIVSQIPNLSTAAKFILNHHEWYNGKGFPLGRQRKEIPKGAQIVLLADQIDFLIRDKLVHSVADFEKILPTWSNERASSELIDAALPVLKNETLLREATDKDTINGLFNRIRRETGEIDVPTSVDAIGVTCEVFSQLIDTKHPSMIGHSKRVSVYSLLIALALNLQHDEITKIKWASLLHDVGKLGVSKSLINKPGTLTAQEYETVKLHSLFTREVLETVTDFKELAILASSDHERYDGKGYPSGIKGDAIPLGARIISVADSFDAMTSSRPYRKAKSAEEACKELERNAGSQYDPAVVKEAIPVLRNLSVAL